MGMSDWEAKTNDSVVVGGDRNIIRPLLRLYFVLSDDKFSTVQIACDWFPLQMKKTKYSICNGKMYDIFNHWISH